MMIDLLNPGPGLLSGLLVVLLNLICLTLNDPLWREPGVLHVLPKTSQHQ